MSARAATLSLDAIVRYDTARPDVNLTTGGTQDWATWSSSSSSQWGASTTSAAPLNSKSGGSNISDLTLVSTTGTTPQAFFRGSSSADTTLSYAWTNGTAPATGTAVNLAGSGGLLFNSNVGTAANGFSLTVTGTVGVPNYLVLYLSAFNATGNLSLSLTGATPVTDSTVSLGGISPKTIVAYQVIFQPDAPTDVLNISYISSALVSGGSGHVGIEAVTLGTASVIPEPTTALLGGLGGLLLLKRRR